MFDPREKSRRDWFRASLEVMVLSVLADRPAHGYAVRQTIKNVTGQPLAVGTLYPLLHRLEAAGLVVARWEQDTGRRRKWYTLTTEGQRRFRGAATDWQAAQARMQALILPALRQVAHHKHHLPPTSHRPPQNIPRNVPP